jgi:hypothetical protein
MRGLSRSCFTSDRKAIEIRLQPLVMTLEMQQLHVTRAH